MSNKYKPNTGAYPAFYSGYINSVEDAPLLDVLSSEHAFALQTFHEIPDEKSNFSYAEGKWTVKQVLLHIIDTEVVFGYRALAIARGEEQPLPGFDQDQYMAGASVESSTLKDLIQCWSNLRLANIALYKLLREEDLEKEGTASGYKVKAGTIGYFIAGHCRYHVNILKERYAV